MTTYPFALLRTPLQSFRKAYAFEDSSAGIFEHGLYLSSEDFWREWNNTKSKGGADDKMNLSFSKYWIRSCMRSTPYGTFAGVKLADVNDGDTKLVISSINSHILKSRLDITYITQIKDALLNDPIVLSQIRLFPNNSIYEINGSYRYVESINDGNNRSYSLASIQKTGYIETILRVAEDGATLSDLSSILVRIEQVTPDEAAAFIVNLLYSQLLVSEMEPAITGADPLTGLIEKLCTLKGCSGLSENLKKINDLLQSGKYGNAFYQAFDTAIASLMLPFAKPKSAIQSDLFLRFDHCQINKALVEAVTAQVSCLMPIMINDKKPHIEDFKKKFRARYEDAEVPLVIALDADIGIGFGNATAETAGVGKLIKDISGMPGGLSNDSSITPLQRFILLKYIDYLQNNREFVEITDDDLKGFTTSFDETEIPYGLTLKGAILKKDGILDETHFTFNLDYCSSQSGAQLLGRFAYGDGKLEAAVQDILLEEEKEHSNAIHAEIVHLPDGRGGNLLLRPIFGKYEIAYVGKAGTADDKTLNTQDLLVSVQNDEIILKSRRYGLRVFPRLTSVHNYVNNCLPLYQFLCELQSPRRTLYARWEWGNLSFLKHLPRVIYKNIVLIQANWRVDQRDLETKPVDPDLEILWFEEFLKNNNMPSRLVYAEGDNSLLLDLRHPMGIKLLLHYLKRYQSIILHEFPFSEDNCPITDKDGAPFTNEMIIPLANPTARPKIHPQIYSNSLPVQEKFIPGSEWLYFKIYCGYKTADKLLRDHIRPFVEYGLQHKEFERFFFIRYKDEFPHIRLRFFNTDPDKQMQLYSKMSKLLQPHLERSTLSSLSLDTYVRELSRYEYDLTTYAEDLFFNDSLAVLRFIDLLDQEDDELYRILFAIRGIDMLFTDFHLDLASKLDLSRHLQKGMFEEFGGSLALQRALNEKYRKLQRKIFTHLDKEMDTLNGIEEAVMIFEERSTRNKPAVDAILAALSERHMPGKLSGLIASYIHMFINRLFIVGQRRYEMLVYHFLEKHYTSSQAIEKQKTRF